MNILNVWNKNKNVIVMTSLSATKPIYNIDISTNNAKALWVSNDRISVVNSTHSAVD